MISDEELAEIEERFMARMRSEKYLTAGTADTARLIDEVNRLRSLLADSR